jgi:hypothetical protein
VPPYNKLRKPRQPIRTIGWEVRSAIGLIRISIMVEYLNMFIPIW